MKKNRLLLIGLLLAGILIVGLAPSMLRLLPTRYAMRLPQPLQAMALPVDTTPLLPTVAAPGAAAGLLSDGHKPPVVTTIEPPPSPTPLPLASDASAHEAQTEIVPTNTPVPLPTATPWPVPASARLSGFTHVYQEWNNCGPATMVMALTYFGRVHSQRDTAAVMRPNPEDRNVTPKEMADFVNSLEGLRSIARVNGDLDLLKRLLANEVPVIIEIGFDPPGEYRWLGWYGHYLLPVAYDDATKQIWVYDSWLGTSEVPQTNADPNGRVLTYAELDNYWSEFNWSYIVLYEPEQETMVGELLGNALNDDVMWQTSLERAQDTAAKQPDNAFYWFNLGTSYNALGEYEKAAVAFDQARAIGLPWRMLWYQFGPYEAYYQVGRYDDMVLLADTTLKDRPYFEESFYYLGLAQAALGDPASARKNLEAAIAFNPHFTPASEALSNLFSPNG
ncbi:MAG TPA: C39 family peptidase [Promineifilum sp.]|nr:C39 family peptidase [Promineifilum sp.]